MIRFRKSNKLGIFRVTATRAGLSVSAGVRGARLGVSSKGQVRRTVGIPGTGLYDTKIVGRVGGAPTRSGAHPALAGHPVTTVETQVVDATRGRRDLLFGDPAVTRLKVVGVSGRVAEAAALAGVVRDPQGWTRGIRSALLTPGAAEDYLVYVLVYPDDNAALFGKGDTTPQGIPFGRLGKTDARAWGARFAGRSVGAVVYLDATPGAELAEVRFFADELAEATPPAAAAPPPAGWYADPDGRAGLRWWNGAAWTEYRSPSRDH